GQRPVARPSAVIHSSFIRAGSRQKVGPLVVARVIGEAQSLLPRLADLPEKDLVIGASGFVIACGGRPGEPAAVAAEARKILVAVAARQIDERFHPTAVGQAGGDTGAAVSLVPLDPDQ